MSESITNQITDINSMSNSKKYILLILSLIISYTVSKYNFLQSDNPVTTCFNNMIISVFFTYIFLHILDKCLEKIEFSELSGLFFCYWITINITENLLNKNDINQNKLSKSILEIGLNIIIFTGLVVIYNILFGSLESL